MLRSRFKNCPITLMLYKLLIIKEKTRLYLRNKDERTYSVIYDCCLHNSTPRGARAPCTLIIFKT